MDDKLDLIIVYTFADSVGHYFKTLKFKSKVEKDILYINFRVVCDIKHLLPINIHSGKSLKEIVVKFYDNYSDKAPGIKEIQKYVFEIGDDEICLVLDEKGINTEDIFVAKIYCQCIKEHTDNPEILKSVDKYTSLRKEELGLRYKTYSFTDFGFETYIGEEDKNLRVCRFCGKRMYSEIGNVTTFKNKAHAFSAFLGNNSVFCNEECDECNKWFNDKIEGDLKNRYSVYRAIHGWKSRKGNGLTAEGLNCKIRENSISIKKISLASSFTPDFDKDISLKDGIQLNLIEKKGSTFANVYRCFAKYAIACLPSDELHAFKKTVAWIRKEKSPYKLPKVYRYEKAPFISKPLLTIHVRKDNKKDVPYCVVILRAMDMVYLCAVPYCQPHDVGNSMLEEPLHQFIDRYFPGIEFVAEDFNVETKQRVVTHYDLRSSHNISHFYNPQSGYYEFETFHSPL